MKTDTRRTIHGAQIYEQKLTKPAFQLLVQTKTFKPGIYLCRLYKDNKEVVETQYFASVLVINPNLMTDNQVINETDAMLHGQQFFLVYPNPASDAVTVCSSQTANCTMELYNDRGILVYSTAKVNATNKINLAGFKSGIYHLRLVKDGNVVETVKLVVQ